MLGFFLTGIALLCFGAFASVGRVLFFLAPMIFVSASARPAERLSKNACESYFFIYDHWNWVRGASCR